jgi:hypothetical protein
MTEHRSRRRERSADEEKREAERKARLREVEAADLDEALADSFPASDPPSMIAPKTRVGGPNRGDGAAGMPQRRHT